METQHYFNAVCKAMRDKSFKDSPQISLGELISEIEKHDLKTNSGEIKTICFDFGTAIPTKLDSYRGYYDELALGYKLSGYDNDSGHFDECKADEFLKHLKSAIGKEYTGWKGGDYIMNENTPLWVANPGNCGDTIIVGVLDKGYTFIILTAFNDC